MDTKERARMEKSCRLCREAGIDKDQWLLVKLEDVEDYLELDRLRTDILRILDKLDSLKKTLRAEVEDDGEKEYCREESENCEGSS